MFAGFDIAVQQARALGRSQAFRHLAANVRSRPSSTTPSRLMRCSSGCHGHRLHGDEEVTWS